MVLQACSRSREGILRHVWFVVLVSLSLLSNAVTADLFLFFSSLPAPPFLLSVCLCLSLHFL